MHKLDNTLQHYGVKGMRWGVLRDRNRPGGADGIDNGTGEKVTRRGRLNQKLDSLKRERQWKTVLREMDKLSTKDISAASKRVGLENDLKTLSKSKIGTKKDRDDYLRRADMSNEELSRKVTRLRAKDNLYKKVGDASKEQMEFGRKAVQIGGSLGIKYALTKEPIQPKDVFDAVKNPKTEFNKAQQDILKTTLRKINKEDKSDLNDRIVDALKPNKSKS